MMSTYHRSNWMASLPFLFLLLVVFVLLSNTFLDSSPVNLRTITPNKAYLYRDAPKQPTSNVKQVQFYLPVNQSDLGQPIINQSQLQEAVKSALDFNVQKMLDEKLQQMNPSRSPTLSLVIHTSVPKSGSTAFAEISEKLSKMNQFAMFLMSKAISQTVYKNRYLSMLDQQRFVQKIMSHSGNTRVLCYGHFYYIDFTKFGYKNPFYISTARDPVERMISNYYFFQNGDGLRYHPKPKNNQTFDECFAGAAPDCDLEWILWMQVPFFCGNSFHCMMPSRWALEQAKHNIASHYLLVGVTEQLGDFIAVLEVMLPGHFKGAYKLFTKGGMGHTRKTVGKHRASENTLRKIRNTLIYQLEQEFYEFVRDQFNFQKNMTIDSSLYSRAYVKSQNYRIGKWTGKAIDYSAA